MNPERNRENDEIQEINQPKQSELSDTEKDEMKRDLEANKPEFEHQGELEQIAGRENAEDQSVEKDINFSDEENINENDDNVDIDISDDLNVSFDAQNDVGDGNLLEEETRGNSDISIGEDELSLTDSENLNEDALEQNGDAFEEMSDQDSDIDNNANELKLSDSGEASEEMLEPKDEVAEDEPGQNGEAVEAIPGQGADAREETLQPIYEVTEGIEKNTNKALVSVETAKENMDRLTKLKEFMPSKIKAVVDSVRLGNKFLEVAVEGIKSIKKQKEAQTENEKTQEKEKYEAVLNKKANDAKEIAGDIVKNIVPDKVMHMLSYGKDLGSTLVETAKSISKQLDAIKEANETGIKIKEDGSVEDIGLNKLIDEKNKYEKSLEEDIPKYEEHLKTIAKDTVGDVAEILVDKFELNERAEDLTSKYQEKISEGIKDVVNQGEKFVKLCDEGFDLLFNTTNEK